MNTTKSSRADGRVKVLKVSNSVPILRVGMESLPEMLDKFRTLTRLSARKILLYSVAAKASKLISKWIIVLDVEG